MAAAIVPWTTSGADAITSAPDDAARSPAEVGGCDVFPANNYWNTPVTHLDVDPSSEAWLSHMSPDNTLHPDFGKSYGAQPVPYGIPITLVEGAHARVEVAFRYRSESDPGP